MSMNVDKAVCARWLTENDTHSKGVS